MRNSLFLFLWAAFLVLGGCQQPVEPAIAPGTNIVTVVGAVHGQHRSSERYSLDVLRGAIKEFQPDIVLVELPPERFEKASANFDQYGEVRESRADDFPELTDVVFPLRKETGFTMIPVAAWTQEIADNRKAVEKMLKDAPARSDDWVKYQAAIATYGDTIKGRSDDPGFIHSGGYDEAVKARQETYEALFGEDLGAGGWAAINRSHIALINKALDKYAGQEKRILILYGAWHKYKISEELEARQDIAIFDASTLF